MNYTDRYFKILIRLTDEYKLMKIQEELDKETSLPEHAPSIATIDAWYCIKDYNTITSYQEMYPPEVPFDDLAQKGFGCTLVEVTVNNKIDTLLCSWDIKKFEDKLNAHVKKLHEILVKALEEGKNSA